MVLLLIKALVLPVLRAALRPTLPRHPAQVQGVMSRLLRQLQRQQQQQLTTSIEEKASARIWQSLLCIPIANILS
uniref:Putative secreted peptide n=1 Tax=Anopheles braziliensis TaxID=58242 RepID=A0A2M3ZVI7_9DIPT